MCGKNRNTDYSLNIQTGSPPRVREKLSQVISAIVTVGITPACAGKTLLQLLKLFFAQDHPRVCGKNLNSISVLLRMPGSPPRVREKRFYRKTLKNEIGITPACAGKTPYLHRPLVSPRDHPRVCGKNSTINS